MVIRTVIWFALTFALVADRATAEPVAKPADAVDALDIVVPGQFDKDSGRDRFTSWPSNLHAVRLAKDKTYVLEMTSAPGFTPFLRVDDTLGNPIAQGQNRINNSSRLRFTPPKDGTYILTASGHGVAEGKYTLTVKPYTVVPPKLIPLAAPAANKPAEATGKLTNDDAPDQYREFPGKVHIVEFKAGKVYVIDLVSKQFDTFLLLQHENGALIAQDDDSGGNLNSRIRFQPTASGRYRLVVSTFNGQMGDFVLRATEQP